MHAADVRIKFTSIAQGIQLGFRERNIKAQFLSSLHHDARFPISDETRHHDEQVIGSRRQWPKRVVAGRRTRRLVGGPGLHAFHLNRSAGNDCMV